MNVMYLTLDLSLLYRRMSPGLSMHQSLVQLFRVPRTAQTGKIGQN